MRQRTSSIGMRLAVGAVAIVAAATFARCGKPAVEPIDIVGGRDVSQSERYRIPDGDQVVLGNTSAKDRKATEKRVEGPDRTSPTYVRVEAKHNETPITGTKTITVGGGDTSEQRFEVPVRTTPQTSKFDSNADMIAYSGMITGDRIEFDGDASITLGGMRNSNEVRLSVSHLGFDHRSGIDGGFITVIGSVVAKLGETTDVGIGYRVVAHQTSDGRVTLNVWKNTPKKHGPSSITIEDTLGPMTIGGTSHVE